MSEHNDVITGRALDQVRRQGYALNDQELDLGLRSCSVPVFDKQGKPLAAINVSASSARLTLEEAAENLGAVGLRKFLRVTLPKLKPQSIEIK